MIEKAAWYEECGTDTLRAQFSCGWKCGAGALAIWPNDAGAGRNAGSRGASVAREPKPDRTGIASRQIRGVAGVLFGVAMDAPGATVVNAAGERRSV